MIFTPATILLPKEEDCAVWSTIACDQFTSDAAYWTQVEALTKDRPSACHITLPEIYLEEGEEGVRARIRRINDNMRQYLEKGILRQFPGAMIYVERRIPGGLIRKGIVGAIDLEEYDYRADSRTPVRATEETVLSRIPPRVRIRKDAALELPHLMLLADDAERRLIEPIGGRKDCLTKVYDFELMQGSGHLTGYLLDEGEIRRVQSDLERMGDTEVFQRKYHTASEDRLVLAVGDGNHSLASAKACYEDRKREMGAEAALNHPSRYALAEIVNLHDESLEFEPIYRVLFDVEHRRVIQALRKAYPQCRAGHPDAGEIAIHYWAEDEEGSLSIPAPDGLLPVSLLQPFLDRYIQETGGRIDYIHGLEEAKQLGRQTGNIAFTFAGMEKEQLFPGILQGGVLPRKTFSMGDARDKRFYLESRRIQ